MTNNNVFQAIRVVTTTLTMTLVSSFASERVPLKLRGEVAPATQEEASHVIENFEHLITPPETPEGTVAVGPIARNLAKGVGVGSHFGRFESIFVVDFYLIVDDEENILGVVTSGIILQTNADGSQVIWKQTGSQRQDGSFDFVSVLIGGTGRFENVVGMVSTNFVPGEPFLDDGWIQTIGQRRRSKP